MRLLLLLVLALLVLGGPSPCWAGVVEDAEDALQTVPSDNPAAQKPLDGGGSGAMVNTSSSGLTSSDRAASNAGPQGSRPVTSTATSGQGVTGGGGLTPGTEPTPPAAEREAMARRKAQDSSDTAMSLMGVLVLLALVVAAGVYSKRAGRED